MDDIRQGIVHIVGPEQGWTLPGTTIVCGDSHTSTHGAFGSLAFGIGTSDVEHVLATQTLLMPKSKNMRVTVNGELPIGVTAKDMALADHREDRHRRRHRLSSSNMPAMRCVALSMEGPHDPLQHDDRRRRARRVDRAGRGDVRLYRRPPARAERRRLGQGRRLLEDAASPMRMRNSMPKIVLNAADIPPMVTWGTSPEQGLPITGHIPDPAKIADANQRAGVERALVLHGPDAGHDAGGREDRPRLHRLLHQWPHRGSARRRRDRARATRSPPMSARWSCRARAW